MAVTLALILSLGQSGYAGSPVEAIHAALSAANVTAEDTVVDIGSGDGRVCVVAAKVFGAKAIGIEMDRNLAELSRATVLKNRVGHLVEIRNQDVFDADLSAATVIYLYHQRAFLKSLLPKLQGLNKGTRVVCLDYSVPGLNMKRVAVVQADGHEHEIYEGTCGNPGKIID